MISKMILELEYDYLSYNMGSIFHGFIIQNIDKSYAEFLHYNQIKPFTSFIYQDTLTKKFYWQITAINKLAYEQIILKLKQHISDEIYIKHKDTIIKVKNLYVENTSFDRLYLDSSEIPKIKLLTPTSFKSLGSTHIFPDIKILLNGVITKINTYSDNVKLEDSDAIEKILSKTYIRDYNLKTLNFHLEGTKIKGFLGKIYIGFSGNKELKNLSAFILNASEYTGFGIKTALGMGGVKNEY